ncbi:hypothetical protein ON010_g2772 [Phytophthora cinnamomi]|nr:hypothetical protein ON010_g2772 [Phytophthora cinnamomi]
MSDPSPSERENKSVYRGRIFGESNSRGLICWLVCNTPVKWVHSESDADELATAAAAGGGRRRREPKQGADRAHRRQTRAPHAQLQPPRCLLLHAARGERLLPEEPGRQGRRREETPIGRRGRSGCDSEAQSAQGPESDQHPAAQLRAEAARRGLPAAHCARHDVELMAKQAAGEFLAEADQDKLLKQEKPRATESWSQFMHNQMTCVHKVFVYYTGYKTGAMRQQFPHWAFGVVSVDPNEPHQVILPNTWTFHGHNPWLRRRGNGKDGEWLLIKKYAADKAPKDFLLHVKTWASSLRPGSMLAIAYQNAGSQEPAWWEAQAWYIWRGDGKQDPAIVYDPETETRTEIHPDDLVEHFRSELPCPAKK